VPPPPYVFNPSLQAQMSFLPSPPPPPKLFFPSTLSAPPSLNLQDPETPSPAPCDDPAPHTDHPATPSQALSGARAFFLTPIKNPIGVLPRTPARWCIQLPSALVLSLLSTPPKIAPVRILDCGFHAFDPFCFNQPRVVFVHSLLL